MFRLVHQAARENAIQAIRQAPDGWVVKVTEPTRNLEQNALLHAELQELAANKKWCNMTLEVEQWKRLLTAAWMRATQQGGVLYVQAVDGQGMDVLYQRTSTLSKSQMTDLIEYIKAWKAENAQTDFELLNMPTGEIWAHKTMPYWIRQNEIDGLFYCYKSTSKVLKTKNPWAVTNKLLGKYSTINEAMNNVPKRKATESM